MSTIVYKHTQTGHLMIAVLLVVILLFGIISIQDDFDPSLLATMLIILFLLVSFTSLQVTVDESDLRIKYGYGLFRKRFRLKEIRSARTVKNHWYYGWGIRVWLWPRMLIYNVSGFDAVEIIMNNGKRVRIGTDEPKELEQAIRQAIR